MTKEQNTDRKDIVSMPLKRRKRHRNWLAVYKYNPGSESDSTNS